MDLVDILNESQAATLESSEKLVRERAAAIPKGEPGECSYCGEVFTRIVNDACGACRDKYRLDEEKRTD